MIVVSRIVSIFFLMVVGFAARKARVLDKALQKGLSVFVLNVAIPFTIIAGFDRSIPKSALPDLGIVALATALIHFAGIGAATLSYRRIEGGSRRVLSYATVFSNCGFMGLPVAESVFGKVGVMYTSIFVIIFQVFIWTYGVSLFSGGSPRDNLRTAILNSGNVSVLVGILLWILPFDLPEAARGAITHMSNLTTPLSMVVVGATLAEVPLAGILRGGRLWLGVAARLVVMPALFYGLMRISGFDSLPVRVAVFLTAMPAAAQSVMFAERYDADVSLASRLVFVSTVLSAATIPLFSMLLG